MKTGEGRERFAPLVSYLTEGFARHAVSGGCGARYPGPRSCNGRAADTMEGFSRLAPFWAAWLAGGGSDGNARGHLLQGLAAGTDPANPHGWGKITRPCQAICEASDIALALWLSREWIEGALPPGTLGRLLEWLQGAAVHEVTDNNWHLFPATILAVLGAFGVTADLGLMTQHIKRVESFGTANGLFRDGPKGRVDWYNAWGFHYNLGMLQAAANEGMPELSAALSFAQEARRGALPLLLHLIGPSGVPIFGRSLHYRGATPAPLAVSAFLGEKIVESGMARRALSLIWNYHLARGMLDRGTISLGYHGPDPIWTDVYSGPASPLWSLRSLIPALALPAHDAFWTAPECLLPVEMADYDLDLGSCRIAGSKAAGEIRILRPEPHAAAHPPLRHSIMARARDHLTGRVTRPQNNDLRYLLSSYSNLHPFCVAPDAPAPP